MYLQKTMLKANFWWWFSFLTCRIIDNLFIQEGKCNLLLCFLKSQYGNMSGNSSQHPLNIGCLPTLLCLFPINVNVFFWLLPTLNGIQIILILSVIHTHLFKLIFQFTRVYNKFFKWYNYNSFCDTSQSWFLVILKKHRSKYNWETRPSS